MADYAHDMQLVVDPLNPENVVRDGAVWLYDPADEAGVSPITVTDLSGLPLPNPLQSNSYGFTPPFIAQVPAVKWKSGSFEGFFYSYKGLRDEAIAARGAAETAAGNAATAATIRLDELIAAGEFEGPMGPMLDLAIGTVEATPGNPLTDAIIASEVSTPGTATRAALDATYVKVNEAPLSLKDPRIAANLNGGTDNTPDFLEAFALMPSTGGEILIPPGIAALSDKLIPPANVTIKGSGRQATTIKRLFSATPYNGILVDLANTWAGLRDLTVDGVGATTELIRVSNNRVVMNNLNLQNAAADGLRFLAPSASPSAHGNSITNVRVAGCPGIGIQLQGFSYDNRFQDIVVSECGTGVTINDAHTRWINLHVWGCTNSGVSQRGKNTTFIAPFLESNGGAGIDVFNVEGLQVQGGRLWRNGTYGATIDTAHRSSFIGVDISENQTYGIRGANSQYVQVIGNQFRDTFTPKRQDRPISMSGTSDYWVIQGNVCRAADHGVGGNTIVGTNNQVSGNIE